MSSKGGSTLKTRLRIALLLILVAGFALRLYRLDAQSVWWDESYSVDLAERPLWEMVQITAADIHPPLHYALLHFWLPLAGRAEYPLRFSSLPFGLLLLPLGYQLGRRLMNERLSVVAAALLAFAPFHVAYSQEARMYTQQTLLATLSVFLMVRLLPGWGPPTSKRLALLLWGGLVFSTALSLWVDYFPAFVIVFQNLFVLLWVLFQAVAGRAQRSAALRFLLRWAGAQGAAFLLYLPWLGIAYGQVSGYGFGKMTTPPLPILLIQTWSAYLLGQSADWDRVLSYLVLASALLVLGVGGGLLWRSRGLPPGKLGFLVLYVVIPLAVFVITLQSRPFFNPRYTHAASPSVSLLLALGLGVAWWWWRPLAVVAGALLLAGFGVSLNNHFFVADYGKDDARSLMAFLKDKTTPRDVILWQTPHPFKYYYRGEVPAYLIDTHPETTPGELTRLVAGKERAFWVTWVHNDTDPWGLVNYLLGKHGTLEGTQAFSGYNAFWYHVPEATVFSVGDLQPQQANFGGQIALRGAAFGRAQAGAFGGQGASREVASGRRFWVTLQWEALAPMAQDLKVFVHLRDAAGHVLSQADRLLWNSRRIRTPYWQVGDVTLSVDTLPIPPGTPPGRYDVELGVYPEGSPAKPLPLVGGTAPLLIGSLKVTRPAQPPPPQTLPIQEWTRATLGPVDLLGYSFGSYERRGGLPSFRGAPGSKLPLTLFWQARRKPQRDLPIALALRDGEGRLLGVSETAPALGQHPTSQWEQGEVVMDLRDYIIPAQATPGRYTLELQVNGATAVPLASVLVSDVQRRFEPPPIANPMSVRFSEPIAFLGYDLRRAEGPTLPGAFTLSPGQTLHLTLYWRALGQITKSYTVFTHLIDGQGRIWAQHDNPPQQGMMPTTSWVEGQVIEDPYALRLDPRAPEGLLWMEIGLYDPVSGQRLLVEGQQDRILFGPIQVKRE